MNGTSLPAILRLPFHRLECFTVCDSGRNPWNWNSFSSELKDALSIIILSSNSQRRIWTQGVPPEEPETPTPFVGYRLFPSRVRIYQEGTTGFGWSTIAVRHDLSLLQPVYLYIHLIWGPMTFPGDAWSLSGQNSPNFGQNAWYQSGQNKTNASKPKSTIRTEMPENVIACLSIRTNITGSIVQIFLDLTPGPITYHWGLLVLVRVWYHVPLFSLYFVQSWWKIISCVYSWLFLSDIHRVRDVRRTEIASGHNTASEITYHSHLTDYESYVLLLDGRLSSR